VAQSGNGKRKIIGVVLILLVLGVVCSIVVYVKYRETHVVTDDAFIEGDIHYVSPRIPGKVIEVSASSNRRVEKNDVLVRLDTVDIEAELVAARENLEVVRNQIAGQYMSIDVIDAQLKQLHAQRNLISKEKKRLENLLKRGAVAEGDYDKIVAQWRVVNAQINATRKQRKQVKLSIGEKDDGGKEAAIRLAEARIAQIELHLDHAVIRAPVSGYVTRSNVDMGEVVAPGQPLMAIVPLEDLWIVANYKETDLTRVRPGQKVVFKVDMYGGVKFKGIVDSIMAGTGAVFSVLPPENATGNYVKVVQRIPVKIKIVDADTEKYPLRIGMSVVPTILAEN